MFGYLNVYKPELKIKEFEAYRAVYCSVCKALKREYGLLSTLSLNYEATFLAVFALGIGDDMPCFEKKRCAVNPFKKCNYCQCSVNVFSFTAAISVILAYNKLLDELHDGNFFKKLSIRLIKPVVKRKYKKAAVKYPELDRLVSLYMDEQKTVEEEMCDSIDLACEPTANFIKGICRMLSNNGDECLEDFGYFLGRWIYLMDAYDDLLSDKKTGNYNVFLLCANYKDNEKLSEYAYGALNMTLGAVVNYCKSISFNYFKPVIYNVVTDGMTASQEAAKIKLQGEI